MWKFADPKIEALPQAERQLIRMGPRNQRIIQDKLREIAPFLGIDPAQLPPEDAAR
jgi:mRNA-degrading endonuclease RelE of RelBE toxin-antitoxin system